MDIRVKGVATGQLYRYPLPRLGRTSRRGRRARLGGGASGRPTVLLMVPVLIVIGLVGSALAQRLDGKLLSVSVVGSSRASVGLAAPQIVIVFST